MILRRYVPADCEKLAALFYETVHTVNAKDYPKEQLEVWATGKVDLAQWDRTLWEHFSLVAEEGGVILGFGDLERTGYLDRLYVHKDHQRQGIATALCDRLEAAAPGLTLTTDASITARPFFEKRGYRVVREQQVERGGLWLTNFHMEKLWNT